MMPSRDANLINHAKASILVLLRHYKHGAYRIIIDPEGKVSLWAIEGSANAPFSISFTVKGRVYNHLDEVPPAVLKSFVEYVQKSTI